jgi:hypothetical protein
LASNYTVTVDMSNTTATTLMEEGSQLVAFAATQGTDNQALPLVWSVAASFGTTYTLSWTASYGAFASSTAVAAGTLIVPGTSASINIGQIFSVAAGPVGSVVNGGVSGLITIANTTSSPFSCGLSQTLNNALVPFCAYPLYGNNTQELMPLSIVVMFFTTAPLEVGEAYSPAMPMALTDKLAADATGPAVEINLTSQTTATVSYDINNGWTVPQGQPAQTIQSSQILPTLIQPTPPPTLARIRRAAIPKEKR